jgi:hypothetical protein
VKYILSLLLSFLLFTGSVVGAEPYVKISPKNRVENLSLHGGYCAWASLETVGRHLGIKELEGVMKSRTKDPDYKVWMDGRWLECKRNEGYDFCMQWKLNDLGLKKWRMSLQNQFNRDILNYAVEKKLPCVVAFKPAAFNGAHACILVGYDSKNVVFIDPNYPGYNYTASREWFDFHWDGFVLVIEKE